MPEQSTNDQDSASCRPYISSSQKGLWLHGDPYSEEDEAGPSTTVRSESTSVSVRIDEDYGWGQEAVVALGQAKDSFMEPSLRSSPSKPSSVRRTEIDNVRESITIDDHVDELESSIASLTPSQAKRDLYLGFVQRMEEEIQEFETPEDRAAFLQRFRKSEWPWDGEQWSRVYAMYLSRNPADIPQDSEQLLAARTRMEQSVQFFGTEGRKWKYFKEPEEIPFDIKTRQRQNFGEWSWETASTKGTSLREQSGDPCATIN